MKTTAKSKGLKPGPGVTTFPVTKPRPVTKKQSFEIRINLANRKTASAFRKAFADEIVSIQGEGRGEAAYELFTVALADATELFSVSTLIGRELARAQKN